MSLDFVRRTYESLGRDDPLWAILTDHGKRHNRWDPEAFFQTGREEVEDALAFLRSLGEPLATGRALDFGCGVGRLTQALAEHFDEVVGVDISSSMIEGARRFNRFGTRVRYRVNTRPDLGLLETDRFDFVYSSITLQHVAPRYGRRYIAEFFRVLRPGGIALFQMRNGPLVRPGTARHLLYRLNREHLRRFIQRLRGRPPMEIHFLARSEVERVIAGSGGEVVDVTDLSSPAREGKSLRYCARALPEDAG